MKKWISEEYQFKIKVISGKTNKDGRLDCRNGHEVGDEYFCEYGCPDGLCQKTMLTLFPLLEAIRSGGDLRNLGGEDKMIMEFSCPDGIVNFRLEGKNYDN